ncbi:probable receptor-like protein kinase At5g18500 [Aristolochia californica]|uniref:probable receptor-like protein kinase At5g18500 n=1 Tax=Aristolochia californica TaxID=171875 RepID=UPI0035DB7581
MKLITLWKLPFPFFLCFVAVMCSWVSAQSSSGCSLSYNRYPNKPIGECISDTEMIIVWDSIDTTPCCRNALNTYTQALAQRALSNDYLFLKSEEWKSCRLTGPDANLTDDCSFDNLYQGSSKCTDIRLTDFTVGYPQRYKDLLDSCSQFDTPSFVDRCKGCTSSIVTYRDYFLDQLHVTSNETEAELCTISLVIAIAADQIKNASWVEDFYRCLPLLDMKRQEQSEKGYIKIQSSVAKALLAVLIATTGLILVVVLVKYVTKKDDPPKPIEGKEISAWSGLYRFSKAEIENAINHGNQRMCLGSGSAGRVYRGTLPSGQLVAIKHIYKSSMSDSFTREVEGLSRIRHPNLVCLFGCCVEGGEKFLVYEFCSNGNLAQHLLRSDSVLSWEERVKILRDCALALRFLHTHPDGCIVHRDIKLTNILLVDNMEPKLSDFGLARMIGMEESKVFTDVRGTIGYMDPEYMSNAKLTCASDVYSFGIVALQILSGRRVIELDIDARDSLTRKAKDVAVGKRPLSDFEDARLNSKFVLEDFESILKVAVLCVSKSSKGRPPVEEVFEEMDKAWKNTATVMGNKSRSGWTSVATPSRSLEMVEV